MRRRSRVTKQEKRSLDLTVHLETVKIQKEEFLNDNVYFEDEEIQNEQSLSDAFEEIHRLKVENDEFKEKCNILQANHEQIKGLIEKLREEKNTRQ